MKQQIVGGGKASAHFEIPVFKPDKPSVIIIS